LLEQRFKATIVFLVLNGQAEKALHMLAEKYHVNVPQIEIGLPKGRKMNSLGCYNAKTRTISVLHSDAFRDPLVILHEFYHHMRTNPDLKHRGTEKYADAFAKDFIQAFKSSAIACDK
jgi:hypothetical protein